MIPTPLLTKILTYLPTFVKLFEIIRDMRKKSGGDSLKERVHDLELRVSILEDHLSLEAAALPESVGISQPNDTTRLSVEAYDMGDRGEEGS